VGGQYETEVTGRQVEEGRRRRRRRRSAAWWSSSVREWQSDRE